MKKLVCVLLMSMMLLGCGSVERMYDKENYESLSNESGTIHLFSGGVEVGTFKNAKVKYTSADSEAVWFVTREGEDKYWQGQLLMDVK